MVQWFHTIVEDLQHGECNGEYALITETELLEKYTLILITKKVSMKYYKAKVKVITQMTKVDKKRM